MTAATACRHANIVTQGNRRRDATSAKYSQIGSARLAVVLAWWAIMCISAHSAFATGTDRVPRSGRRWPASVPAEARGCVAGLGGSGLAAAGWKLRSGLSSCGQPGFWARGLAWQAGAVRPAGYGEASARAAGEGGGPESVSQVSPARQASAAPAAKAAAKAYPPRAPSASLTCPAAAEPAAVPTASAEVSQAMASVSRPGLACCSTKLNPPITIGESTSPDRNITAESAARPGIAQNVAVPAATAHTVTVNRRRSGARQAREPYHRPPAMLPSAYPPRITPASGLCPCPAAKSTVARSIAASIAPKNRNTGASVTRPRAGSRRPRARRPGPGTGPAGWAGWSGGSVARCAANSSVPARHVAAATARPEAGYTSVANRVTSTGPATKITSSATDSSENAACSRDEPASSALHRARTIEPSCGVAAPATPLAATSAQAGARACAPAMSAAVAAANTSISGRSTARWPARSASRATSGDTSAYPAAPAAATTPARPYRPDSDEISSTVPSPNMEICIRPRNPAAENRSAPGLASAFRYGLLLRISSTNLI